MFKKGLVIGFTFGFIFAFSIYTLISYLDRPEMRVDEAGNCLSAVGPNGPIDCKDIAEDDWGHYDLITVYAPEPK